MKVTYDEHSHAITFDSGCPPPDLLSDGAPKSQKKTNSEATQTNTNRHCATNRVALYDVRGAGALPKTEPRHIGTRCKPNNIKIPGKEAKSEKHSGADLAGQPVRSVRPSL